jgi:hypothetical protein
VGASAKVIPGDVDGYTPDSKYIDALASPMVRFKGTEQYPLALDLYAAGGSDQGRVSRVQAKRALFGRQVTIHVKFVGLLQDALHEMGCGGDRFPNRYAPELCWPACEEEQVQSPGEGF